MITIENWVESDRRNFRLKKSRILSALSGSTGIIEAVNEQTKEDVFYMLLFCLCVPQSKAIKAEEAINILRGKNYFHENLTRSEILSALTSRVRFHSTKTDRLVAAKSLFLKGSLWSDLNKFYEEYSTAKDQKSRTNVLEKARSYLIKTIKGIGMKLASHFLRNVGMSGLAILDVHILDGMIKRGLITAEEIKPLTNSRYESISITMQDYADQVGISIDELDMLLWSQKTGYVFK